ncbi:MAG: CBS domain-containing protein [Burkholderiales bacterium]
MSGTSIGLALLPTAAFAEQVEQLQTAFSTAVLYAALLFVIVVACYAYFMRLRDNRRTPVGRLFGAGETIHCVGPDSSVAECVRTMTAKRIGALIVMEGERLTGIFTERDALNRVLAAGLDPVSTKISAVMTKDPFCIAPGITVAEAMELVTKRRFRHLPIVENGKVLAVISSGDLTHWLVKDKVGEVQELVDLAARS